MAKLQEFTSYIKDKGLMRTARYTIHMGIPLSLEKYMYATTDTNTISILCDQIQVPGLNYTTTANPSYGETREIPYQRMYDNISMSFYVDNDMLTKKYFDDWLFSIQDPNTRTFNYYRNYTTKITIKVEDLNNQSPYAVDLFECYPKSVSAVQLDYASKEVMKISVNMAYKYWKPTSFTRQPELNQFFNYVRPEGPNSTTGITIRPNTLGIAQIT